MWLTMSATAELLRLPAHGPCRAAVDDLHPRPALFVDLVTQRRIEVRVLSRNGWSEIEDGETRHCWPPAAHDEERAEQRWGGDERLDLRKHIAQSATIHEPDIELRATAPTSTPSTP